MTDSKKIFEDLLVLIKAGDQEKTENFLVEHFKEFPEEMQREIVFTFLGEAADDYLKDKVSEYLAQTAALQGLGEALGEMEKTNNE